jgi:hypothetical protein
VEREEGVCDEHKTSGRKSTHTLLIRGFIPKVIGSAERFETESD